MGQAQPETPDTGRRSGRGRLSSIDTLPEAADEHILWANAALRDREMPQTEILREFNARLADLGIRPISKGAFSRYSVRVAIETRKLEATRQITEAVLARMPAGDRADSTLAAIELVKFRILEMVTNEDVPDPKLLANAALSLSRLSSTALREAEGRRKDRKDQDDRKRATKEEERKSAEADAATVEKIAAEAGLSEDRVRALRAGVLGVTVQ